MVNWLSALLNWSEESNLGSAERRLNRQNDVLLKTSPVTRDTSRKFNPPAAMQYQIAA
jgi:hypothetical protein